MTEKYIYVVILLFGRGWTKGIGSDLTREQLFSQVCCNEPVNNNNNDDNNKDDNNNTITGGGVIIILFHLC